MLLELSLLPIEVQQQILNSKEPIAIMQNGVIIKRYNEFTEPVFDYDLERMKQAVEAPRITVPKFSTNEEFLNWIEKLTDDDFKMEQI